MLNWLRSERVRATGPFVLIAVLVCYSASWVPHNEQPPAQCAASAEDGQNHCDTCAAVSILYRPLCSLGNAIYDHREVVNASSTLVIGAFTLALFFATFGQLRHLRKEFNATHRPKMIVHAVEYFAEHDEASDAELVGARLWCFNTGDNVAANVIVRGEVIAINTLALDHISPVAQIIPDIQPGALTHATIRPTLPMTDMFQTVHAQHNSTNPTWLFCVGTISYRDTAGNGRVTGFCFRFDRTQDTWFPLDMGGLRYAY